MTISRDERRTLQEMQYFIEQMQGKIHVLLQIAGNQLTKEQLSRYEEAVELNHQDEQARDSSERHRRFSNAHLDGQAMALIQLGTILEKR